jgi:hypothetical protein
VIEEYCIKPPVTFRLIFISKHEISLGFISKLLVLPHIGGLIISFHFPTLQFSSKIQLIFSKHFEVYFKAAQ